MSDSLKKIVSDSSPMQGLPPRKEMPYVRLGNSGLRVSKIILGCMTYGDPTWAGHNWFLGEKEAFEHIKFAFEAGINTFDTADVYSDGGSEKILGKAIKHLGLPRESLVIMTKIAGEVAREPGTNVHVLGLNPDEYGSVNQWGLSRKHIFAGVKASLERLQLDYVDVLQCHRADPNTPIEETMQALHDVVKAGWVRYIGMSSCHAWQFHQMQNYAITHNLTPFISMQNHYNLAYREEEREMFPTLKLFGVGSVPWSPLARGLLTRPSGVGSVRASSGDAGWFGGYANSDEIVKRVEELAEKKGVPMAQISLAWLMAKEGVTAPVVGTTSLVKLQELIGAIKVKLTDEEMRHLEEPYQPRAIFGHA